MSGAGVTIIVNGERREVASTTLDLLLQELGYSSPRVAVAVNREFVPRGTHAECKLSDGDEIEILAPMQGG